MHIVHLSFRHFSRPSRAFFRQFYGTFKTILHTSNICILAIFLSATFSPSRAFFRPFFRHFLSFSVKFYVAFKLVLPASNKCVLSTFLSVTFHALLALFSALFSSRILSLISVNFYVTFKPSFTNVSNKCILPIFPSLFAFSRFFRRFSVAFYSFSRQFVVAFMTSLARF
jgi:hypothetical protein